MVKSSLLNRCIGLWVLVRSLQRIVVVEYSGPSPRPARCARLYGRCISCARNGTSPPCCGIDKAGQDWSSRLLPIRTRRRLFSSLHIISSWLHTIVPLIFDLCMLITPLQPLICSVYLRIFPFGSCRCSPYHSWPCGNRCNCRSCCRTSANSNSRGSPASIR